MERCHDPKTRPLLLHIQQMGREKDSEISEDEAMSLEKMLRAMLTDEPLTRATPRVIAESDWMMRWRLPAFA